MIDFRFYIRPCPRDSDEDDHSSHWNNRRWTPQLKSPFDRLVANSILVHCFSFYLKPPDWRRWERFRAEGRTWGFTVYVGNKRLSELGQRRREQAAKQLAAKMRRLLNAGRRERKPPANK